MITHCYIHRALCQRQMDRSNQHQGQVQHIPATQHRPCQHHMRDMDPHQCNLSSKNRTSDLSNASLLVALHSRVVKHTVRQSVLCRTLRPDEACTYPSGHSEEWTARPNSEFLQLPRARLQRACINPRCKHDALLQTGQEDLITLDTCV